MNSRTMDKRAILTKEDLILAFKQCRLARRQHVMVHAALSKLGFVVGGAEMLRKWPGAERSEHPARSFAAVGEQAKFLTQAVDDGDYIALGSEYDQERNISTHKIGDAQVRLLQQRPLVDWAVKWMERNRPDSLKQINPLQD